jgi:2-oxoglutarate dehydrogenase complex dehydrogenase (E1) component-like enzyme
VDAKLLPVNVAGNIYMIRMICYSVVPEIELGHYGLNENDKFTFSGILSAPVAEGTVANAVSFLQKTYSNTMSAEFSYLEVFVLQYE